MSESFINEMNYFGREKKSFLFIIDYELKNPLLMPIEDALQNNILFFFNGIKNYKTFDVNKNFVFKKYPISFVKYKKSFDCIINNIRLGNSFLANLTFPTEIHTDLSLEEVFYLSEAPFRLLMKNKFVVFSPEPFIRIRGRKISSFPMKGTIDASVPDAENVLLNDPKEIAEHNTIVDLIRNDLSMVADQVKVENFRYIDKIISQERNLLQVSSEINGLLPEDFDHNLGSIIWKLLPAGSICGAPKSKTVQIIKEAEQRPRGYYTGIFGIYDGTNLDSAVMIRFMENDNGKLIYRSGGGITSNSVAEMEYSEMLGKIYLPIMQNHNELSFRKH